MGWPRRSPTAGLLTLDGAGHELDRADCDTVARAALEHTGIDGPGDEFESPEQSTRHEQRESPHHGFGGQLWAGPNQSEENPLGEGGGSLHDWAFALRVFREPHAPCG